MIVDAIIDKEVLLCDLCNDLLVDETGKVLENCKWIEWGLVCCHHKGFEKDEVIESFKKDQVISKSHKLFTPMVILIPP